VRKMGINEPKNQGPNFSELFRDLELSFVSRVVNTSGALRVHIPARDAAFWDIQAGDQVQVHLTKLKRSQKSAGNKG